MMGARWEAWEDELIRQYYPIHGSRWDGWGYHLADRSRKAIRARAAALHVRRLTVEQRDPVYRMWQFGDYKGEATLGEWAEILGIGKTTIRQYSCPSKNGMRKGRTFERVE